jgi:hypothetical protein
LCYSNCPYEDWWGECLLAGKNLKHYPHTAHCSDEKEEEEEEEKERRS